MPMASVNKAIFEYLKPENSDIPNLGVLYRSLPKIASEADLFTSTFPGMGVGGAIYMFLTAQSEKRIALGGPPPPYGGGGNKMRTYTLALLIVMKSDLSSTEDGWDQYMAMIDGLTARIQANRTAGTDIYGGDGSGVVFSMGEGGMVGSTGGNDIEIQHFVPRTIDGAVTLFQGLAHVTVLEDFVAT